MSEATEPPRVERSDPPFAQIAAYVRGQIQRGELQPGDMVPSARKITQQWQVSLATATKVLGALQSEGLVEARPGVGTVVSKRALTRPTPRDRASSARRTGRIYRDGEYAKVTHVALVPAPLTVAEALGIGEESPVIRRHRITYRDDLPLSASTSWFKGDLAEVAPRLLSTERVQQGTWRYIEEVTGHAVVSGRDELSAGAADARESEDLGVPEGSPVLRGRNWYLDAAGAVIEYGESVAHPDRWSSYEYEIVQ